MDNLHIKSPRQTRALSELLKGPIAVKDLGSKIGALNPRQIVFELRFQGFEGIIETRRFTVTDQDGKRCHPGEYYIPEHLKGCAEKALREYVIQAHAKRSGTTKKPNNAYNSREE